MWYCFIELVQRIFLYGDKQHTSLTPDKELNSYYIWHAFLHHHVQQLEAPKTVQYFLTILVIILQRNCLLFSLL